MSDIYHRDISDPDIHEPKGISSAAAGDVYVSDGTGTGEWRSPVAFDPSEIDIPIGSVIPYAGLVEPNGWFFCQGQAISRSTYSGLFSVLGTTFGEGDGSTTFNLPDCRGRTPTGRDNMVGDANRITTAGSGVNGNLLGATGGAQSVQLIPNELPVLSGTTNTTGNHTHTLNNGTLVVTVGINGAFVRTIGGSNRGPDTMSVGSAGNHVHTATVSGGNVAHSNVQPTLILNILIYHGVL